MSKKFIRITSLRLVTLLVSLNCYSSHEVHKQKAVTSCPIIQHGEKVEMRKVDDRVTECCHSAALTTRETVVTVQH